MEKYFGISVIGEEHILRNMPCQDACEFSKYKNGYFAVVSDGLGSKKYSDIGSEMACKAVIKTVKQLLSNNKIRHSTAILLETIHKNWIELLKNNEISECSATCLFAIKYRAKLIVGQLGDGGIFVISKNRDECFVLRDDKDNLFSNMTYCLNEKFLKEQWKIKIVDNENILAVILCTDGITEDIQPAYQLDFAKEFYLSHKYLRKNQREKRVRKMLQDWHLSGSKDDKTIAYLTM